MYIFKPKPWKFIQLWKDLEWTGRPLSNDYTAPFFHTNMQVEGTHHSSASSIWGFFHDAISISDSTVITSRMISEWNGKNLLEGTEENNEIADIMVKIQTWHPAFVLSITINQPAQSPPTHTEVKNVWVFIYMGSVHQTHISLKDNINKNTFQNLEILPTWSSKNSPQPNQNIKSGLTWAPAESILVFLLFFVAGCIWLPAGELPPLLLALTLPPIILETLGEGTLGDTVPLLALRSRFRLTLKLSTIKLDVSSVWTLPLDLDVVLDVVLSSSSVNNSSSVILLEEARCSLCKKLRCRAKNSGFWERVDRVVETVDCVLVPLLQLPMTEVTVWEGCELWFVDRGTLSSVDSALSFVPVTSAVSLKLFKIHYQTKVKDKLLHWWNSSSSVAIN